MSKWHREKRCLSESTKWHPTQVSEFNIQKILRVKHWCSSTCGMTTLRLWDFRRTSWSTCWYTLSIKAIQHQRPYSKTHSPGESNTPKSQVGWEMPATDCMIILLNHWIVLTMKTSKWIKLSSSYHSGSRFTTTITRHPESSAAAVESSTRWPQLFNLQQQKPLGTKKVQTEHWLTRRGGNPTIQPVM